MNPFTSRRAPREQAAIATFNDGVKRARRAHLNQTTCHRCGTSLDLDPGRVDRVCEGCKEKS